MISSSNKNNSKEGIVLHMAIQESGRTEAMPRPVPGSQITLGLNTPTCGG